MEKLTENQVRLLNKDSDSYNTVTSFETADIPDLHVLRAKGLVFFNGPVQNYSYGLTFKGGLEVYKERYQGYVVDYKKLRVEEITYLVAHGYGHEVKSSCVAGLGWGHGYILPGEWKESYFSPEFCDRLFETKKEAEEVLAKYLKERIKEHASELRKHQAVLDALAA
jgi:hypothetical protein